MQRQMYENGENLKQSAPKAGKDIEQQDLSNMFSGKVVLHS